MRRGWFRRLPRPLRRPVLIAGVALIATLAIAAIFAPLLLSRAPDALNVSARLQPPSAANWFGTDEFGRDVFTRVIYGGRLSLGIGAATVIVSSALGIALGLIAGFSARLDRVLSRVNDAMMSFPDILLAIALVAALRPSAGNVVLALGIVYTPRMARMVRASTLVIRELPYVEAARALGVSTWRILSVHVLRNLLSPIIVQATFVFAFAMLAEAGLSFLGVGVSPVTPSWGTMIAAARPYYREADWLALAPGLAIMLTVFSLQVLGDALRDLLDPRLRGAQ
jgi:peptide/nickel transport system permease protein